MSQQNRILVVDDEPRNVRLLVRLLQRKFAIEAASSGKEALVTIPKFRPDLILLDVSMPGIDGYETCRRIRADERHKFTKVILVSGNTLLEERLAGYEAGADDYVTKPFVVDELIAKIDVFLRLKRAEEVDRIKGDLLTLFSHETKTPLAGIIGMAELIRENATSDENVKTCAEHIYCSANRLLEFVRKTSLLCDLKSGRQPSRFEALVEDHYKKAVLAVERELPADNRTLFECSIQGGLTLALDWELFDLVLSYLLANAAKYSPDSSVVKTTFSQTPGVCRISVKNQGQGIELGWIDKIFDEFAVRDVVHHHRGQGISLAIAKHIVELHNGTIEAVSSPGEGAEFNISLPID